MEHMEIVREVNRQAGVCYAVAANGIELPVVDVTHPTFALSVGQAEQRAKVDEFLQNGVPFGFLPKVLRRRILQLLLRGSMLAQCVQQANGTFMSGMSTYLLKLGPEMLGSAYANPIDRRIAAALPALGVRMRLQDVAYLMADILKDSLRTQPKRPLDFVNIAGGPGMDSLNALLILRRDHPGILAEREVQISVLDLDEVGPRFGQAALAALVEGPLRGSRVGFRHERYDWNEADGLRPTLNEVRARGAIAICSSEGGLFEYGTDAAVETNLRTLSDYPEVQAVVGSVTRADAASRKLLETSSAALRPRGLNAFRDLAQKANWNVARVIEGPFSDQVVLQ
jgi:hypothetical protein